MKRNFLLVLLAVVATANVFAQDNNERRREYPEDREVRVRYLGDLDIRCKMVGSKENAEWERIEDESEYRHPMAGFAYYQTIKRNRAERKRRHEEQLAAIR